ncbi:MAG: phospholipase A, partial [Casimicrobiaceae bacterium]
ASLIELQHVDTKLQLSFKTKLAQDILGSASDLWFGYTQQSYWQAINSRYSSPFRESNYEPEAVVVHPLQFGVGPVHAAYAAVSLNHQSNGQGGALSRSWNRVMGELALTAGPFSMQLRPWLRLDASTDSHDDNPDIEDFIGRGEVVAGYRAGRHVVTLRGRHSLRSGPRSHGSAQLDWAYRLAGTLNAHVQLFTGYGESLIDYNLRQTTLGVGLSFFD